MLAQPQVQFPASVWERAGLAKCRRLKQGAQRGQGEEMPIFKDEESESPERQEDLEAAGRMTEE